MANGRLFNRKSKYGISPSMTHDYLEQQTSANVISAHAVIAHFVRVQLESTLIRSDFEAYAKAARVIVNHARDGDRLPFSHYFALRDCITALHRPFLFNPKPMPSAEFLLGIATVELLLAVWADYKVDCPPAYEIEQNFTYGMRFVERLEAAVISFGRSSPIRQAAN